MLRVAILIYIRINVSKVCTYISVSEDNELLKDFTIFSNVCKLFKYKQKHTAKMQCLKVTLG